MIKTRLLLSMAVVFQSFAASAQTVAAGRAASVANVGAQAAGARAALVPISLSNSLTPALLPSLSAGLQAAPAPLTSPSIAALQPAQTLGVALSAPEASPMAAAQLAQAGISLAAQSGESGSSASPQNIAPARSRWEAFWHGSKAPSVAENLVPGQDSSAPLLDKPSGPSLPTKESPKKDKRLRDIALTGALSIPPYSLPFISALTTWTGLVAGAYRVSLAMQSGAEWLAQKLGWSAPTEKLVRLAIRIAIPVSMLLLPTQLPAVWLAAVPYLSGGGILVGAFAADKIAAGAVASLARVFGWSEKTKTRLQAISSLLIWSVGGSLGLEAAGYSIKAMGASLWGMVAPYKSTAEILLGTYVAGRLVRKSVGKTDWTAKTKSRVRLIATSIIWIAGISFGLSSSGVSPWIKKGALGAAGITVALAAQELLGNIIECVKTFLNRPFIVGNKVKIGSVAYTVKDMNLHDIILEKAPGETTPMTYAQLAGETITIYGKYSGRHKPFTFKPSLALRNLLQMTLPTAHSPNIMRAAFWAAASLGIVLGLPALTAWTGLTWLTAGLPYLQGGAMLWMTRSISDWLTGVVTNFIEKAGGDKYTATICKIIVQAAAYAIGGTVAVSTLGLNSTALLAGIGVTAGAIGFAAYDTFRYNIIQRLFWIFKGQPFNVGDTLEIDSIKGTVIDMNMQYVVIEHADNSYTLVSYNIIKRSLFSVTPKNATK